MFSRIQRFGLDDKGGVGEMREFRMGSSGGLI